MVNHIESIECVTFLECRDWIFTFMMPRARLLLGYLSWLWSSQIFFSRLCKKKKTKKNRARQIRITHHEARKVKSAEHVARSICRARTVERKIKR